MKVFRNGFVCLLDHEHTDNEVARLGSAGMTSKMIAARTTLTENQVNYRLHKAGIVRADYRNGQTRLSRLVIAATQSPAYYVALDKTIKQGIIAWREKKAAESRRRRHNHVYRTTRRAA